VTDSGLTAGTTYFYRIIAVDADGQSDPSDVASATTTVDAPASPTGMTANVAGADRIDLEWDDVADESGYLIERSADGGSGWTMIGTTGRDVTKATDASLEAGTTYWYRVVAANDAGDSPPSDAAWATTDQATTGDQGSGPDPASEARVSMGGAGGTSLQSDTNGLTRRRIAR
jgi:titin